jgi:NADPH2:quinone reductase
VPAGSRSNVSAFASTYTKEISLAGALRLEDIAVYGKQATGEKYLINPNKGIAPAG